MSGIKRSQNHDGQDMPIAKRHASNIIQVEKSDDPDLPATKNSEKGPKTIAKKPIIIDLSFSDEQSPNNTTLQPRAIMKVIPSISASDSFPSFKKGTVHIVLDPRVIKYQYCLHKSTLSRVSPAFARLLDKPLPEPSEELKVSATDAQFRFELVYSDKFRGWILRKTPFTIWKLSQTPSEPKHITTPPSTIKVVKKELIEPLEHVSDGFSSVLGADTAPKEPNDQPLSIIPTAKPVGWNTQTPADSQDNLSVEVDQSSEKLESTLEEKGHDSTTTNQSLIEALIQTAEMVGKEAMRDVDEPINSSAIVKEEENDASLPVRENKSSNQEETVQAQALTNNESTNSAGTEKSTDDSVPKIPTGIASPINTPNAPEESISPAKNIAQHICSDRQLFSSSGYPLHPPVGVCEAYNNLFLIFYNRSPKISKTCIWMALKQCEDLILAAKHTHTVPVVRPYLGYAINRFGQAIYGAIATMPYRWLELSLTLESAVIFKEAIIHIVGQYVPGEDFDNALPASIPVGVQDLIIAKVRELSLKKMNVNERLCASSIIINSETVTFLSLSPTVLSTWIIVQVWRDWFCKQMSDYYLNPYKIGELYRTLRMSGDAYLPAGLVKAVVEKIRHPVLVDMDELRQDLYLMKDFAQEAVRGLCENHSMVDIDEVGVRHLTCTTVMDYDLPWYEPAHI